MLHPRRPWLLAPSFASPTAATCPTSTPRFSITAARRFISASISAAIRRKFIASRAPRASSKSPNTPSPISRNPAKTNPPAITPPAIRERCAKRIRRNGTRTTTPSPARNPSGRDSPIAALPGTKKNLTSGDFSKACATTSKSPKTPSSATTPPSPATWPTNPISARPPSPGTPPPTKSNPDHAFLLYGHDKSCPSFVLSCKDALLPSPEGWLFHRFPQLFRIPPLPQPVQIVPLLRFSPPYIFATTITSKFCLTSIDFGATLLLGNFCAVPGRTASHSAPCATLTSLLSFLTLTKCFFCNSFVLTFMHFHVCVPPTEETMNTIPDSSTLLPSFVKNDREPSRCHHRVSNGKRCRLPGSDSQLGLCLRHFTMSAAAALSRKNAHDDSEDFSAELLGHPSGLASTLEVKHFLSRLLVLVTSGRISPRRAAVLVYITNQLHFSHQSPRR